MINKLNEHIPGRGVVSPAKFERCAPALLLAIINQLANDNKVNSQWIFTGNGKMFLEASASYTPLPLHGEHQESIDQANPVCRPKRDDAPAIIYNVNICHNSPGAVVASTDVLVSN